MSRSSNDEVEMSFIIRPYLLMEWKYGQDLKQMKTTRLVDRRVTRVPLK